MPKWYEITRTEDYQSLPPKDQAEMKQRFFQKRILPILQQDDELKGEDAIQFAFENFMNTPDDTGQGYLKALGSSVVRGAGEVIPGTIEGIGALADIKPMQQAGRDVRGGLEELAPVNPIYQDDIGTKLANVTGNIGSMLATGGVGGLAGRALAAERIAAGTTTAARTAATARAFDTGAKAALYGTGAAQGAAGGAREAEKYGLEGPEAYLRTLAGAASEVIPEAMPFGTALETALPRRLLGAGGEAMPGIRRAALTEGTEEAATQLGGNIATETLAPIGVETPGLTEGVLESAALGAFGGSLIGVAGKLTTPDRQTQVQRDYSAEAGAIPMDEVPDQTEDEKKAGMEKGFNLVVDPTGKTAYVPPKIDPEVLAGLSPAEQEELGITPPPAPTPVVEEPTLPPVANEVAVESFENVEASADVAPATAAVLDEIASTELPSTVTTEEPKTPVTPAQSDGGSQGQLRTAAGGSIPDVTKSMVPQEEVVSSEEIQPETSAPEETEQEKAAREWQEYVNRVYAPTWGTTSSSQLAVNKDSRNIQRDAREQETADQQIAKRAAASGMAYGKAVRGETLTEQEFKSLPVKLPEGYVKQGDLYVYRPQPPAPDALPQQISGSSVLRQERSEVELPQVAQGNAEEQAGEVRVQEAVKPKKTRAKKAAPPVAEQPATAQPEITPLAGPLRPKFVAGETVVFTHPSGQQVIGTIDRVSGGGNATIKYNWNGKKEQEIVLQTRSLQRPVASLAAEPKYQYTQEQNARKAARVGLPSEPGFIPNAGKVISDALEKIASDTSLPPMIRAVARALQTQNFDNVDLRVEADGRYNYAGYYLANKDLAEIRLNLRQVARGQVDTVGVFLHEALHHVTLAKLRDPQGEVETQAVQALDTLRKRVRAYAGMQQKASEFYYELGSTEEFVSAVFTNPEFQDFLASIPDTFAPDTPASKFRSVLSEVFRYITQLVTGKSVQKGSAIEQAMTATLALFETRQRPAETEGEASMAVGKMDWDQSVEMMRSLQRGMTSWSVETAEDFREEEDKQVEGIMSEFFGGAERVSWNRVKAARLIRIWNDFSKLGFVRDEKGMDAIADQVRRLIVRLHVANAMSGHDTYYPQEPWELTEEDNEKLQDFLVDEKGGWYVSDYGLPYLYPLYQQLRKAETAEDKLQVVDKVLNVVHQRSDLAEMFVEGGSNTLNKISGMEGETSRFSATPETTFPTKTLTEDQARATLTKRFGQQVADKVIVAEFPAISLRNGEEPVEVDAFLKGGKIHLNLKFIDSEEMLIAKAEHEMAHAVWSNLRVQGAWKDLRASMPDDAKQRIADKVRGLGYNPADIDEETMVRFFEEVRAATPPSKWQAFMDAVINAFRQFFGFAPDARTARLAAAKIIAEAESAVARGLDPVSAAFGASIPQAVLDNLDADYMAAVERGDMAAAQRMVDEAAEAAGYNVSDVGNGITYETGDEPDSIYGERDNVMAHGGTFGFYFSDAPAVWKDYAKPRRKGEKGRVNRTFLSIERPFRFSEEFVSYDELQALLRAGGITLPTDVKSRLDRLVSGGFGDTQPVWKWIHPTHVGAGASYGESLQRAFTDAGYDGVIHPDSSLMEGGLDTPATSYVVFSPEQIKSADPVTRDNDGSVIPLSKRFDLRSPDIRYSLRQQDLKSQDWRTEPAATELVETKPQQQTVNEAGKIIGEFLKDAENPYLARRAALNHFTSAPGLRPEVRMAGLYLLARQMDLVANANAKKGRDAEADLYDDEVNRAIAAEAILRNDPEAWQNLKFDIDSALALASRDAGLVLNIVSRFNDMTPEGFIRRKERAIKRNLDNAVAAETGGKTSDDLYNEIARIWQLMREAGPGKRGEAIAAALKAFMPKSVSIRNIIDAQSPQAGFREKMEKEGEQLVRNFFQMIAGPRDPKGPLAEFDSVIQNALSDSLRRAMEKAGLLKKNESVQMTDIDKLVRAVSTDSLRLGKLAKADEAMQAELDAIEDPERRAMLQQAWDEAMARMATTVAPESVVRRAVNAELQDLKINWNEFFDKGGDVTALRNKVTAAVLNKVTAKLNVDDVMEPGGLGSSNIAKLKEEIKNAFEFAKEMKRQSWLAYREEVEVRRRIAERKKAFLEALKGQRVAESAIARIGESLAGPPKPGAPKDPVNELVNAQVKKPDPEFVKKLGALGVNEETARLLEELIEKSRADAAEAKPFLDANKAVEQFIKSMGREPTKKAVDVLTPLARKIVTAATADALSRRDFQNALAEAFDVPVMTQQQADEFRDLVRRINEIPDGVLQDDLKKEMNAKLAQFDGIPAVDMLMSVWYSNILFGPSTTFLQAFGNAFNTGLKSGLSALSNNPKDTLQAFRGAFTSGLRQGLNDAQLAMQGRSQFKPTATTDRNTIGNLEILSQFGPKSWTDALAWVASAGTLTKYIFRLFSAIDAITQSFGREWQAYMAASRAARKEGKLGSPEYNAEFIRQLGGDTREFEAYLERAKEEQKKAGLPFDKRKVIQRAYELRTQDRPPEINRLADRFANQLTFTSKPEGIGRLISSIISAVQRITVGGFPVGRLLQPFNHIISNMFEQSLDYTPVGLARGVLGGHLTDIEVVRGKPRLRQGATRFDALERRQRIAASMVGTAAAFAIYGLAKAFKDRPDEDVPFMIYGMGPPTKDKRDNMPQGWAPNTIKIGDTYYKYAETPLNTLLGGVGAVMDAMRYGKLDEKNDMDRLTYIASSAMKGLLNQGVLTNLRKTFEVFTGDATASSLKSIPVSTIKGMLPFSGAMKEAAIIADPTKVSDDTLRAALLRDIPVVKGYAGNPDLNRFGEPVKFEGLPVVRRVMTQRVENHVSDWLGRNSLDIPGMGRTIEVGQYLPKAAKTWVQRKALQMGAAENGVFTPEQDYRFKQRAGQLTKTAVERLMTLKKNPRPAEREQLQKIINKEVESARRKAMMEIVREDY